MIRLSLHAQQQAARRGIALSWIEATVRAPDWTAPDNDEMIDLDAAGQLIDVEVLSVRWRGQGVAVPPTLAAE